MQYERGVPRLEHLMGNQLTDQRVFQELKKTHRSDYDSHASYRFAEE